MKKFSAEGESAFGGKNGIPSGFMEIDRIDNAVLKNFNESIEKFKSIGYETEIVNLPDVKYSLAVCAIIIPAEVPQIWRV